jgi:glutamate-1-semialdehyde 2,1-aminomutase
MTRPLPDPARLQALLVAEGRAFVDARPKSADLLARGRHVMAGGVPMPWMIWLYDHPPPFFSHGQGSRFTDVDGHSYVDFNLADLSNSAGYGDTPVSRAVAAQAMRGVQSLLPAESSVALSEALAARTSMPRWHYTLSSSAASTEVFRLARAVTGKARIVMCKGGYHGHIDQTMVETDAGGTSHPTALGLSPRVAQDTTSLPFNDLTALRQALQSGDVAAVITEPALTNAALVLPAAGYLVEARRLALQAGALFILDETHTWQMAFGGMRRQMGLSCDVLILGKGLGSGVPLGAYGLSVALSDALTSLREGRADGTKGIALGGTIYGNPLSEAAALAMLTEVQTEAAYRRIEALGTRLADGIDAMITAHGLPWRAFRHGPRSGFCLTPDLPENTDQAAPSMDREFNAARRVFMANRGIWDAIWSAGPQVGFAHDAADIDHYLAVAEAFLAQVI